MRIINYGGKMPSRKHSDDIGADVYALSDYTFQPHETICVPLGFGIELPKGYGGFVLPRSSMGKRGVSAQTIPVDPNYRGEIHAIVTNYTDEVQVVREGDRIAQLVVIPCLVDSFDWISPEEASKTDRGRGGFGSTGQ